MAFFFFFFFNFQALKFFFLDFNMDDLNFLFWGQKMPGFFPESKKSNQFSFLAPSAAGILT